jgi:hypothetical protein
MRDRYEVKKDRINTLLNWLPDVAQALIYIHISFTVLLTYRKRHT